MLPRVLDKHLVELATQDLPGLRTLMRIVLRKTKWFGELSMLVDELHTILFGEVTPLELSNQPNPLHHRVTMGDQRLTDVKTRKVISLVDRYAVSAKSQNGCGRGPGRPAANDNHIRLVFCLDQNEFTSIRESNLPVTLRAFVGLANPL